MPDEDREIKVNYGRRRYDMDCQFHTDQLESLQADVNKNNGKYSSLMWFLGVIGTIVTICLTVLLGKTSAIESLLTDSKVTMAQHTEQIMNLKTITEELKNKLNRSDSVGGSK